MKGFGQCHVMNAEIVDAPHTFWAFKFILILDFDLTALRCFNQQCLLKSLLRNIDQQRLEKSSTVTLYRFAAQGFCR